MVDAGDVATIAAAGAVIVALAVGLAQLRQGQRKRREQATAEIIHELVTPEFIDAIMRIFELPPGASAEAVRAPGRELEKAIAIVDFRMEALGVLVFHRSISLHIADDLTGGMVRGSWSRVASYVEETRRVRNWPNYGEWWQWLAERLEELDRPEKKVGAHVAYRDWRP